MPSSSSVSPELHRWGWVLGALGALGALPLLPHPLAAQPPFDELALEEVAGDFTGSPVAITHAGDERLFITLQEGLVVVWDGDALLPTPFLDLRGQVSGGNEQGLLSVAFHPRFDQNGFFFVDYTDLAGDTVVARYRVSADSDRADPSSGVTLLAIAQPFGNHNGGQLQFGPDGYLYIGMGDGGSANDPLCNAQRSDTLLGKMLRIDVDANVDQPPFFGIPPDNPYRGPGDPPDEVWARGLRNPWRFSFDRASGDLFIADVGQNRREEVNFQPADSPGGESYGWKVMEGTLCLSDQGCPLPVPGCQADEHTDPILEHDHAGGDCSVTGGYVYRGSAIAGLDGVYFYGDFCSGVIRAAERNGAGGTTWSTRDLSLEVPLLSTFGEDADGELYVASLGGRLFRLTGPSTPPPPPAEAGRVELVGGDRIVAETEGSIAFAMRRVDGDDGRVTVEHATVGASAIAGEDYAATSSIVAWDDGETGLRTFEVPLIDDGLPEKPEAFEVVLRNATGGATLGTARAAVTILDDDLAPGPCVPGPTTLCLTDGRFRVDTWWRTPQGGFGPGMARPLTLDTGTFWFFQPENVEVVVKVIDACIDPFDRFWVFAGGLTNVGVTMTVVDSASPGPEVREYRNPLGVPFAPIQDTDAFATCP